MKKSPFPLWLLMTFFIVAVVILAGGFWFYSTQEQRLQQKAENELLAIAQLKADEIVRWRADRVKNAQVIADDPFFLDGAQQVIQNPGPEVTKNMLARFRKLQERRNYSEISLVGLDGTVHLQLNGRPDMITGEMLTTLEMAQRQGKSMLTDLHRNSADDSPHIDIVAPLFREDGAERKHLGALILSIDARDFLYPLIQSWPTASPSAETLLVRRDGDTVLFLNDLRHQPDTALTLRIPMSREDVPAVMAASGKEGVLHGKDYRGVEVLSALKAIPDSPWFMVAKIDEAEVLSAWRFDAMLILAALMGVMAALTAIAGIVWQRYRKAHYRDLFNETAARLEMEQRYHTTLMSIGDGVIGTNTEGRVELMNPVAEKLTGWTQEEARGKPLEEVFRIFNEKTRQPVENPVRRVLLEGIVVGLANHTTLISRNGKEWPIADCGSPIRDASGAITGAVLVFHDQSEERAAQKALRESETWFRTTFYSIGDGVITTDEKGRLQQMNPVAEMLTGWSESEACGRPIEGIFHIVNEETRAAVENPVTRVLKEGTVVGLANHTLLISRDGTERPIADAGSPIIREEGDISGTVLIFRDQTKDREAEEALKKSEERFRSLFETMTEGVALHEIVFDEAGRPVDYVILDVNPAYELHTGIDREAAIGRKASDLYGTGKPPYLDIYERVSTTGESTRFETYFEPMGKHFRIWVFSPGKGQFATVFEDISDRKRAEEERQAMEKRLSQIIDFLPDATLAVDKDRRIIVWNRAMEQMTGVPASEMLGKGDYEYSVPFYGMRRAQLMDLLWKPDHEIAEEYPSLIREDGNLIAEAYCPALQDGKGAYVWAKAAPLLDAEGNIVGGIEAIRDTTERRQAEEAIRDSQRRLSEIIEFLPDATLIIDGDGKVIAWNRAIETLTGVKAEEMLGRGNYEYAIPFYGERRPILIDLALHPDPEWEKKYTAISRDRNTLFGEAFVTHLPKGHTYLSATASVLRDGKGENIAAITCIRDNTERKRAEEKLRDSEERFSTVFRSSPMAIAISRFKDNRLIDVNPAWQKMTGYAREEAIGQSTMELDLWIDPSERDRLVRTLHEQGTVHDHEFRMQRRSGEIMRGLMSAEAVHMGGEEIMLTMAVDITERKRIEEELRRYSEEISDLYNHAPCGYHSLDADGTFMRINDTELHWLGYTRDELIGKRKFNDLMTPESQAAFKRNYPLFKVRGWISDVEYQLMCKDGTILPVIVNATAIKDSEGDFIQSRASLFDNTERIKIAEERKGLEERLQRAEKMESLGLLAGGVAHDLNNVLGIMIGYSQLIAEDIEESSPIRSHVQYIRQGAERASTIVQDLLTLARRGVQNREVVNLNAIIADAEKSPEFEKLLSFHPGVRIKTRLDADLLNIKGSPVHLSKTMMNLLSNAAEAMKAGGLLTVTTCNEYLDRPVHGYDTVQEGDYVVLTVSDTGEGISISDMKRIFEPFYTKKVMGRSGTGLGLAVVWGTVKDHNGYINVESEVGKGTTFTLYFPVTREDIPGEQKPISVSEYVGNGETILIVDDVEGQRELAARMLERLNYNVTTVASGEEAVQHLKHNRVDLVVLDMIMDPGMDGLDTYRKILEIHPKQKAIIVSGFSESDRVRQAQALGAGAYIRKPYVRERLGSAVREELNK